MGASDPPQAHRCFRRTCGTRISLTEPVPSCLENQWQHIFTDCIELLTPGHSYSYVSSKDRIE